MGFLAGLGRGVMERDVEAMEGHKHLLTVQSPLGREEQNLSLPFPTLCLQEWEPKKLREPKP